MYKILILPSIGVVFILSLRTKKEQKQLKILELNETEYRSNRGSEQIYILESWEAQNRKRKNGKGFDTY
jgi:hypothetical protein